MIQDKIKEMLSKYEGVEIIMLSDFGSHLYGTATKKSDRDYKGIFKPSMDMMLLGKIPDNINYNSNNTPGVKNTSEDVDIQLYSIQFFMDLARRGDTTALDLLHSPFESTYITSDMWECLRANRKMFYTKTLKAFIGYAKNQAAKYGLKGDRLDSIEDCLRVLSTYEDDTRLSHVWPFLPKDAHSRFIDNSPNGIPQYMICGKTLQSTMTVSYARNVLEKYQKEFGERAIKAQSNQGVDFKALSHACRAALEVKEILETGDLRFPLKNADRLREFKEGLVEYKDIVEVLENLIDDVEKLSMISEYPETVSKDDCDSFLITLLRSFWS